MVEEFENEKICDDIRECTQTVQIAWIRVKNGKARVFTYRIWGFAKLEACLTWVPIEMTDIASTSQAPSDKLKASATDDVTELEFKPLTAEEAQAWRLKNPALMPWRIIGLQALVGVLMVLLTWLLTDERRLAASVAWGVVAVVIPAMVFVRALSRQMQVAQPKVALVGLFAWELVKIVLTVALLLAAPKLISDLSWLALVASFVVTIKVYWLAMALGWVQRKSKSTFY